MKTRTSAGLGAIGLGAFLLVWEALVRSGALPPTLLPAPSQLPEAFLREVRSGFWLASVQSSLGHYLLGLVLGAALGVGFGVVTGLSRTAEALVGWIVRLLRPIPGLAWVPFAILWFGVSTAGAVFIVGVGVFWICYFATLAAVRAVDRDLMELADAYGYRSAPAKLVKIVLPAAAPGILAGLRTALGQAWMAVVAAELFGVTGLGQRMMQASSLLATDIVVVYMITMAALYGLIDTVFVLVQGRVLAWKA
ncbi:nitrate ABC transporter permease [Alsobacter soli]|uniref:Nitrate ABC transporter permease n=1 Tax=Alsobacter soli TaxID=2109933 RepID=A0A2T1HS68_9HYPH|nr:ABC transporter permease [Alsobacter soli]PSC04369.1 nitrate ABC transporter permease [Alsobacter soli]